MSSSEIDEFIESEELKKRNKYRKKFLLYEEEGKVLEQAEDKSEFEKIQFFSKDALQTHIKELKKSLRTKNLDVLKKKEAQVNHHIMYIHIYIYNVFIIDTFSVYK